MLLPLAIGLVLARIDIFSMPRMNWREKLISIPILIMIFWIGIYPDTFIKKIEPSVERVIELVKLKNSHAGDVNQEAGEWNMEQQNKDGDSTWISTGE